MITVGALAVMFVLVIIQRTVLPGANGSIFNPRGIIEHEMDWVMTARQGGPIATARVFFLSSMVAPRTELSRFEPTPVGPMFSFQHARVGSSGPVGLAATLLWSLLLLAGLAALLAGRGDIRFRLALGTTLLGQLALHMLYGEETFLYTLHIIPLLVLCAAQATLGRLRPVVLAVALALLLCAAWNNARELTYALSIPLRARSL
jgi:hypothetical protein